MVTEKEKQGNSANMNFESSLSRLTEISGELEEGEPTLDDAINLYTEGMKNAKFCREKLSDAEKKIKVLVEENGDLAEKDFDGE